MSTYREAHVIIDLAALAEGRWVTTMGRLFSISWTACVAIVVAAAAAMLALRLAHAQDYPTRAVALIVPVAAGGLTDTMARLLGQRLAARIGQPVVIDNRPGGGGILAMQLARRAPADGYTLVLVFPGAAAVNPVLYKQQPYDTMRDFAPVARVASYPMVLIESRGMPATTVEFIALAKSQPGTLNYGSAGNTTTSHLAMELLKRQVGLDIVHIPFKGEAPALNELIAGRLAVQFQTLATALPHIKSGDVRALGVAIGQRSKLAPDIPTLAEAGIAGMDIPGWYGVLAPAGTPKPITVRLNKEITAIVEEPETLAKFAALGATAWPSTPEELGAWIQSETDRWRVVITESGITAD